MPGSPLNNFKYRPGANILAAQPGKITRMAELISYSEARRANILAIYLPDGNNGPLSCNPNLVCQYIRNRAGPSPRGREPGPANPGRTSNLPTAHEIKTHPRVKIDAPRLGSKQTYNIPMDQAKKKRNDISQQSPGGRNQAPRQPPAPEKWPRHETMAHEL